MLSQVTSTLKGMQECTSEASRQGTQCCLRKTTETCSRQKSETKGVVWRQYYWVLWVFFPLPNLHCLYPNPRDLLADISCLETPGIKSPHKAPLQTQFSGSEAVLLSVTNGLMQSFHYGINVCTFLTPHRYKTRLSRLMWSLSELCLPSYSGSRRNMLASTYMLIRTHTLCSYHRPPYTLQIPFLDSLLPRFSSCVSTRDASQLCKRLTVMC